MSIETLLAKIQKWGVAESDSARTIVTKQSLLIISLLTSFAGLIWGLMYYLIYGLSLYALIPCLLSIIVGLAILIFIRQKKSQILTWTYLFCILLNPHILQCSLGGFKQRDALVSYGTFGFFDISTKSN